MGYTMISINDANEAACNFAEFVNKNGRGTAKDLARFCGRKDTTWFPDTVGWLSPISVSVISGNKVLLPDVDFNEYSDDRGEESKPDMVNHPSHYKTPSGLEAIDVIEAFTYDLTGIEAVDTGNALKYLLRWKHKNGVEDLKKAVFYANHLINHVENKEDK